MNTAVNVGGCAGWAALIAGFFYVLGLLQGQRTTDDEPVDFSDLSEEVNR